MKEDRTYVLHIRDAIERIVAYTKDGKSEFLAETIVQDAVIRNLEVIGEAAKQVSEDLRAECPEVPWAKMAGLRDVLIHGYMTVDLEIVWDVVSNRLPPVADQIADLLEPRQL
ncbi:MAG: DUF86 domain-containing protein [Kiloniellales bacterium]|nr:DUF86 domain-containing protein [Kiloniellales bacterium]